ncbi:hypothetical protein BsWGS_05169 [Bradybaena similaris]
MKRRREFYEHQNLPDKYGRSIGQPQGEVGDRIIFSQDEEFSMSIEFSPDGKPVRETRTKHLKRPKDSERLKDSRQHDKRYLKCPAGLRIAHLKKFIRSKFTLPQHIEIDLFYETEPLYDSYSLMDVAYIYLWKRDCVLQLFYSFYEVPTKKRKLQSVAHISKSVSKSSRVIDKPAKNFGSRKSSSKKEKQESKKQSRMSGKMKKSTAKAVGSSGNNASQQEVAAAKGGVSSNRKRKHSDISSARGNPWLSKSVSSATSLDTPARSQYAKQCLNNMVPVEKRAQIHTPCHSGTKQMLASPECSITSQLCRDSKNCSIISHHSRKSTACSVTSHFCTSRPCVSRSGRDSKKPADSEVSITLLIKSSDSQDYKHENSHSSLEPITGRLQNDDNTSEIRYNTYINGDTLSEIKDNSFLAGEKFLEVKNTILKKCKKDSKVTEMNIENGEVVSEVKVSLNGQIAPELTNKQLVNGQFIFRLKNGKITNGDLISNAKDDKSRCLEPAMMAARVKSDNKGCEVTGIKVGRTLSTQSAQVLGADHTKVHLGKGVPLVKNVNIHARDSLDVKYNNIHNGETTSFVQGKKLNIDRISNVKDRKLHNDDIAFDLKDKKFQCFEKISNVMDKKVENNNKFCDKSFQDTEVTLDFKDKNVVTVDLIPVLKDEKLATGEMSSLVSDKTLVRCKATRTAHFCEQFHSVTNSHHVKLEATGLSAMSSHPQMLDIEDKKLKIANEKSDLQPNSDDLTLENSQSQRIANESGKLSEISAESQVSHSGNCVDKEQVLCNSGFSDSSTKIDSENVKEISPDTSKDSAAELKEHLPSTPDTTLASIQNTSTSRSDETKKLENQLREQSGKDVVSDACKQNGISHGSQASCAGSPANSTVSDAANHDKDEAVCASNESLSHELCSEGGSNPLDCRIGLLPCLCPVNPNCVDTFHNSVLVADTVEPVTTTQTEHVALEDSVSTAVATELAAEHLTSDSVERQSAPNKVKNKEEHQKQRYSPEVFKEVSSSDQRLDKHNDSSKSVNLISRNVPTTSSADALKANPASFELHVSSSDKPSSVREVTIVTSSPMPVPLKAVQSTAASMVSLTNSSVSYSTASTSSIPSSSNCFVSASIVDPRSLNLISASSRTKDTTTVKAAFGSFKTLPTKTSSPQSITSSTIATTKNVNAVSHSPAVAISPTTPQNKCLSPHTVGNDGFHWSRRLPVPTGMSNTPVSLPRDAPPKVSSSGFVSTSGSSEVASHHVSSSNTIPSSSTSSNTEFAQTACVVSSFLNLPPADTSPVKRSQLRSNIDSTNSSATDKTLPSEATKVDNFLFDVKSPDKELPDSSPRMRVSSSCGKETQKAQFRTKLNSLAELGGLAGDKSPKTNSHITAVHQLPKTISQASRPYSTATSVSTSPSSNTKYDNSIIQTTKISTLIPKSSSVNSKAGAFLKSPAYPTTINSLLMSRSILNNSLPSHYPRIDGLSAISGASCVAQELMPKSSTLSSSSSSTASSLLSSTTSTSHHRMSSSPRQSSKGRGDKSSKHKTIPPLCIPKSSLIGPTTLKLQRSPGTNDHYIFSPLLHYSPPSQHKGERSKSKESKSKTSHPYKSAHTSTKGNVSKQRVPTIKISDINRNPVIVENGGSGSSHSSTHCHTHYKSYNDGSSRPTVVDNGTPRDHSRGRNDLNSLTGRHEKLPVRDILRPSDSELLLSRHWHAYSTAELLFSGFSLPAHTKLQDLQYDTDAMPLDYSQSSSKS